MKKFSKVLLSICMAFVVSFSLIACGVDDDDDFDNGGSDTPPTTTLDRSSFSSYSKWMFDNPEFTQDYEGTVTIKIDGETETFIVKSDCHTLGDGSVIKFIAQYDVLGRLKDAEQFHKKSTGYDITNINVSNRTYEIDEDVTELEAKKRMANLYCAHVIIAMPYQAELNQGHDVGYNLYGDFATETVTNPEDGKYVLTRTITSFGYPTITHKITIEDDRVISYKYSCDGDEMNMSYTYKNVTINEDLSDYEEVE